MAFESTEDIAGAGGFEHFRAIRANVSVDPPTFLQIGFDLLTDTLPLLALTLRQLWEKSYSPTIAGLTANLRWKRLSHAHLRDVQRLLLQRFHD